MHDIDKLDSRKFIIIKGARVHNLKNIDIALPRNKFIVITGLSGSGKSSLAFDTLYAEGQRRYVESLSSYARQFLGRMDKPDVDYILGISPAVAIEQKVNTRNPRSTVGTSTEIYDYLKLLFARIGQTYSPISGELVKKNTVDDVVKHLQSFSNNTKVILLAPLYLHPGRSLEEDLNVLLQKGFIRVRFANTIYKIEDLLLKENQSILKTLKESSGISSKQLPKPRKKKEKLLPAEVTSTTASLSPIQIVVDRFTISKDDESNTSRIADSIQTAFFEGQGECSTELYLDDKTILTLFSNRFFLDGILFEEPTTQLFSFNNPYGACPHCEGRGDRLPQRPLQAHPGALAELPRRVGHGHPHVQDQQ